MKTAAYIMGISPPQRLAWLKQTIDHMDAQLFPFEKKIVSIDQIRGHGVPSVLVRYFENKGWEVLLDSWSSRVQSMDRAFSYIDTDIIFYNEDDVLVDLPTVDDVRFVFDKNIDDRKCGMLSLALGGTQYNSAVGNLGDLRFMEDNTIISNDDYRIFQRLEEYKSAWFFEFPGLFIKTDLFKECHNKAKGLGKQIEQALTISYLDNGYSEKYYKASIAKSNALSILLEDGSKVNSHCRLLTNLDPSQGNSPLGGCHNY